MENARLALKRIFFYGINFSEPEALKLIVRLMKRFSSVRDDVLKLPSKAWPSMGEVLIDSGTPASLKYWTHFILWEMYPIECRKTASSKNQLGAILWKQAEKIARHGVKIKSLALFCESISLRQVFGKYAALSRNVYCLQQVKITEADKHEIAPDYGDMYVEVMSDYLNLWYPPNRALTPFCIEREAIQQTNWEKSIVEFELVPKRSINKLQLVPTAIALTFVSSDDMYQFIEAARLKHVNPVEKEAANVSVSDCSHAQDSMFDNVSSSAPDTSFLRDLQPPSQPGAGRKGNFEWLQDMSQTTFQGSPPRPNIPASTNMRWQQAEKPHAKSSVAEQCGESEICGFDSSPMGPPEGKPPIQSHNQSNRFSQSQSQTQSVALQCENNQLASLGLSAYEHFAVTAPNSQCFNNTSTNVIDRVRKLETDIVSMKAVYQFQITEKEVELQDLIEKNTRLFNEYIQQKVKSTFL